MKPSTRASARCPQSHGWPCVEDGKISEAKEFDDDAIKDPTAHSLRTWRDIVFASLGACLLLLFTMGLWKLANVVRVLALTMLAGTVCDTTTVLLPSYPLAVKSPYLSTWVPGKYLKDAATAQPQFWAGQNLTWPILARINGVTYSLFNGPTGSKFTHASTKGFSYTSTHTFVDLAAGAATIRLDFFSPVLPGPNDYLRQSLPYSYLTVTVGSSTTALNVQVLSGIDQTWTAQNGAANFNYTTSNGASFWWFHNPNEIPFTEYSDMATYGSVIFGTTSGSKITYGADSASSIFNSFATNEPLKAPGRNASGSDLVALSKDLGNIKKGSNSSVTFVVGFDREQAIDYLGSTQTGLYKSKYPTVQDAISYVLQDYSSAYSTSLSFDSTVRSKAESVNGEFGSQYADIIEASVRQTFGAMELTVPANDTSAIPQVFLKEISSDGNVNTVDVIYQTWPVFISLNPNYIKYMLEPIMSYQQSGRWPESFVIHDIGTHYPNATGHDDGVEEDMPLFESSSLFILMYAYQKYTGDTAWAAQYQDLLKVYANYLVQNALYPQSQLISVDAIPGESNQTGLAVQSAIGLKAAAIITGNHSYAEVAASYANKIYEQALGLNGQTLNDSSHFTYYYGKSQTWNALFPSYSDVLLNLSTFPSEAWDMQSKWYASQIQELGLPFAGPITYLKYTTDNTPIEWGLLDWNLVVAATCSVEVQQAIVNTSHAFLTNGLNSIPFGTKYYVEGPEVGVWIGNEARSTVGSNFALLALDQGTWAESY